MTVVQNIPVDAASGPIPNAAVTITLITGADTSPGYTGTQTLVAPKVVYTDATTGQWSADLIPNASITPTGTYYRVTEPNGEISTVTVPASGGPYQLSAILVTPPPTPSALAITGVQVAANGTVAGIRPEINVVAGSNITVAAVDNPGANRVDVTVTSTSGGANPATTVTDETTYGISKAVGTATNYAREDHTHGSPSLTSVAPAAEAIGSSAAVGTATAPARADHVHAMPSAGTPTNSAVGDTAAPGVAATVALSDHTHGREAFGAVTAQTSFGASSANGTATAVAHADHTHGTPSLASTAPTTSAVGDAAATGSGTTAAKADHTHGREAFGSAPATTESIGQAAAAGTAATPARSDHVHPMAAAGAPVASAVGDTQATGSATTPAASDHRHAREAFGSVTALTAFNVASANGTATTVSHSDHVHGSPLIAASDVPNLDTSKITSGSFATPRIPDQDVPNLYTGAWWSVPGVGSTSTSAVPVLNQAYLVPFIPTRDGTIAGLGIEVVTTDTGVIRLGLASSSGGLPGSWLNDFGTVAEGSAGVFGKTGLSVAVTGGTLYYLAAVPQTAVSTLTWRTRSSSDRHIPFATSGTMPTSLANSRNAYVSTGWSGALSGAITTAATPANGPILCVQLN